MTKKASNLPQKKGKFVKKDALVARERLVLSGICEPALRSSVKTVWVSLRTKLLRG